MSTETKADGLVLNVNALLTEVGVNMGDHAQDVTKAVVLDLDMTVRGLCEKFLTKQVWARFNEPATIEPDGDKSLIIRLAEAAR